MAHEHEHLWEYDAERDKLITHEVASTGLTVCGKLPWEGEDVTAPIEVDDTWFGDHDREPEDILLCQPCGTEADRALDSYPH